MCGLLGSCRSCFCGSSGSGSGGAVILCFGLQGSVFNGQLTCGETVGLIENALVTVVFGNQMIDGTDTVDGGMQIIGFIICQADNFQNVYIAVEICLGIAIYIGMRYITVDAPEVPLRK